MTKSPSKIVLSRSQDIPFNKLVLSQANVRRVKAGVSVEDLAEDIARRGLLQGLSARPVLDAEGAETGAFEMMTPRGFLADEGPVRSLVICPSLDPNMTPATNEPT